MRAIVLLVLILVGSAAFGADGPFDDQSFLIGQYLGQVIQQERSLTDCLTMRELVKGDERSLAVINKQIALFMMQMTEQANSLSEMVKALPSRSVSSDLRALVNDEVKWRGRSADYYTKIKLDKFNDDVRPKDRETIQALMTRGTLIPDVFLLPRDGK